MKARIEKKLSKRLVGIAPTIFRDAWLCKDITELAENQGSRVSHCLYVGGGVDYWGEGMEAYTAWEWWLSMWPWFGPFELYSAGHRHEYYPNIDGFKQTTRNLLSLAKQCELLNKQTGGGV